MGESNGFGCIWIFGFFSAFCFCFRRFKEIDCTETGATLRKLLHTFAPSPPLLLSSLFRPTSFFLRFIVKGKHLNFRFFHLWGADSQMNEVIGKGGGAPREAIHLFNAILNWRGKKRRKKQTTAINALIDSGLIEVDQREIFRCQKKTGAGTVCSCLDARARPSPVAVAESNGLSSHENIFGCETNERALNTAAAAAAVAGDILMLGVRVDALVTKSLEISSQVLMNSTLLLGTNERTTFSLSTRLQARLLLPPPPFILLLFLHHLHLQNFSFDYRSIGGNVTSFAV